MRRRTARCRARCGRARLASAPRPPPAATIPASTTTQPAMLTSRRRPTRRHRSSRSARRCRAGTRSSRSRRYRAYVPGNPHSTPTSTTRLRPCRSRSTRPRRRPPTSRTRWLSKLTPRHTARSVLAGEYVIPLERELPALLLQLPRRRRSTGSTAAPLHQRGGDRLRQPHRHRLAGTVARRREQAGLVVAYDLDSGEYPSIYGMGRHNHENSVAHPGYGHPVVLSGDDTFLAPSSQLYLYMRVERHAVWNDQGTLYAFLSDNPRHQRLRRPVRVGLRLRALHSVRASPAGDGASSPTSVIRTPAARQRVV